MGYRLRVLGRLALEVREGAATRPRSLALLAILAAAGEAGVPRDKLLLYLWPESNTRRARNSLHQTLYAIRRHLGEDAVQVGTPNLQLNPACFTSDLWEFLAALDRGSVEEAIALYDGPFLEGFVLPDLPEFDHWVEEQRGRIARRYADAWRRRRLGPASRAITASPSSAGRRWPGSTPSAPGPLWDSCGPMRRPATAPARWSTPATTRH